MAVTAPLGVIVPVRAQAMVVMTAVGKDALREARTVPRGHGITFLSVVSDIPSAPI